VIRYLADTQLLIWLADRSEKLPKAVAAIFQDDEQELIFSLASIWETSIKFGLGRPDFTIHPRQLREGLLELGFLELGIADRHVIGVARLPLFHRDPFDRLLVAQAQLEGLTLMTTDKKLARYGPHVQRFK
jgi:PIN domain nuclease of toxin-antitoxin system